VTSPLANQNMLVTGASSGVGQAICQALAAHGVGVYLVGRRLDALEKVADQLRRSSSVVEVLQADLTVDEDIRHLVQASQELPKPIDVLIHSAGIIYLGPIETSPVDQFDMQYRCNVRAPYLLTQALLPMLKRQKGQVVFINSTAGLNAQPNLAAYAATKHALRAVTESLRAEVNSAGVRVLSVYLGRTATPMQRQIFHSEGKEYHAELLLQPEHVAETVVQLLSLPRTAEATDITLRPAIKSY